MKRSISFLFLSSLLLSSCFQRGTSSSSDEEVFVTDFLYSYHQNPNGSDRLLGLWDGGYVEEGILKALPHQEQKDFYVAGDILRVKSSAPFITEEIFPSRHILPKDAVLHSVTLYSAEVKEQAVTDFEDASSLPRIMLGRDGESISVDDFNREHVYASYSIDKSKPAPSGLYAFDPRWLDTKDLPYCAWLDSRSAVLNEQRSHSIDLYEPMSLQIFYNKGDWEESELSFEYDSNVFDLFSTAKEDPRWMRYNLVPKKRGTHPFAFSWRGTKNTFTIDVDNSSIKALADFDLSLYPEFESILSNMKRHTLLDPYPSLEECPFPNNKKDAIRYSFESYSPNYKDYLFDSCYYPSFFPSASGNKIAEREISFQGIPGKMNRFAIQVSETDPGHTNPQDPIRRAFFYCVPKEYRFSLSAHARFEAAIAYGLFNIPPKVISDISYTVLKAGPTLYGFFEDESYAYSLSLTYREN